MSADYTDLRQRLEGLAEEIADLALDRLRESIEGENENAEADERRLARARRAVEKAVYLLSECESGS